MEKITRISIRQIRIIGAPQPVVLERGVLVVHQEYIQDGLGGQIPGMRSWEIITQSDLPPGFGLTSGNLRFEADPYSGTCFVQRFGGEFTTFQGTGPLTGYIA